MKPVARDQEVWFGVCFTGWGQARRRRTGRSTPPGYGFRRMRLDVAVGRALRGPGRARHAPVELRLRRRLRRAGSPAPLVRSVRGADVALWQARDQFGRKRRRSRALRRMGAGDGRVGRHRRGVRARARRAKASRACSRRAARSGCASSPRSSRRPTTSRTRVVAADLADAGRAPGGSPTRSRISRSPCSSTTPASATPGRFEKLDAERLREMVQLNCVAPVVLTHRLLPAMRARGRGAIMITGSVAGRQALPLHGVYSATKAFDLLFGESLWAELEDSGIDVLVLEPGSTETEFQQVADETRAAGEPAARRGGSWRSTRSGGSPRWSRAGSTGCAPTSLASFRVPSPFWPRNASSARTRRRRCSSRGRSRLPAMRHGWLRAGAVIQ